MNSPCTIRRATEDDIPHIAEFNRAMALETEDVILDTEKLHQGVTEVFKRAESGFYIVAEVNNQVVGCLMITYEWSDWRNGNFWWIQSVYVKPDFRSRGIFKTLYKYIETLANQKDDIAGIRLYVHKDNSHAQNVYLKMGMSRTNYQLFEYEKPTNS